jgi:hypothetical protein
MLLSFVAEIPDEVAGARLPVEQSSQRFDAVSIDEQHRRKLMRLGYADKSSNRAETSIFTLPLFKSASHRRDVLEGWLVADHYCVICAGEVPVSVLRQYANQQQTQSQERHFLPGVNAGVSVPESR